MKNSRGILQFVLKDCWLRVQIKNDMLQLKVFDSLTQNFHLTKIPFDQLPKPANYLFETSNQLFSYFQYLLEKEKPGVSPHLSFSEPYLKIRDEFGGSHKQFELVFVLRKADLEEKITLLKQHIKIEEEKLSSLKEACSVRYAQQSQQKSAEKALISQLRELNRTEKMLNQIRTAKVEQNLQLQKERQSKIQQLKRIRLLATVYQEPHKSMQIQAQQSQCEQENILDFVFPQILPQSLTVSSNKINLSKGHSTIVRSIKPVPLFGKWSLRFSNINQTNGITFGFTSQDEPQAQIYSFCSHAFGISTNTNRSFWEGLQKELPKKVYWSSSDVLKIVLNRNNNCVQFSQNSDIFEELAIPSPMQDIRIYPFLQFSAGDEIQILN